MTVLYANALRADGIKVNAADPDYVATDLNHHTGHRTVHEGADAIVQLAAISAEGPTGTFTADNGPCPW